MKLSILLILFGISQVLGGRKNLGGKSLFAKFCEKGQPDYSDGPQCSSTNQNCGPYGLCLLKSEISKTKWSFLENQVEGEHEQGVEWQCTCFKTKKSRKAGKKNICSKKELINGKLVAGVFKSTSYSRVSVAGGFKYTRYSRWSIHANCDCNFFLSSCN